MGTTLRAMAAEEPAFALKDGDRIVFLGDSITLAGMEKNGYIQVIIRTLAAREPKLAVEIFGAGISGNKVRDLQARLEKDVLEKKPTVVVIYIGINDIWHGENGTQPEPFAEGLRDLIKQCTAAGAMVMLCTPTVIGEKKGGANEVDDRLEQYAHIGRKLAKESKIPLCDLRKAFTDHLEKSNPDNKESGILTYDRVHLNDAGNALVAKTMLKVLDPEK